MPVPATFSSHAQGCADRDPVAIVRRATLAARAPVGPRKVASVMANASDESDAMTPPDRGAVRRGSTLRRKKSETDSPITAGTQTRAVTS
jgi:hypothetical protein